MPRTRNNVFSGMTEIRADYEAAKPSRFRRARQLPTSGASADYHLRNQQDFLNMLELVRDFERNEPLLRQAVRRLVNNVNPGAMTLDPDTGDDVVDNRLADRWRDWGSDRNVCHVAGLMDWPKMTNTALGRTVIDGDGFGLTAEAEDDPHIGLRVQTHEAHRCRTPNRSQKERGVCGVEKNSGGRAIGYWFTNEPIDPNETVKVSDVTKVPRYDAAGHEQVFHVFNPERFSQSRGITYCAPIANAMSMRDDVEFAELVRRQVVSCVAILEQWDLGAKQYFEAQHGTAYGPATQDQWVEGGARETIGLRPGQRVRGAPGLKLEGFAPNIPGESYFNHVRQLLAYMAVNLDLPLIVLLLDAADANFSSYRNVLDQARMTYREIQRWFGSTWHSPIYRALVRRWAVDDDVLKRILTKHGPEVGLRRLLNHSWKPQGYEYIEPVKDATRHKIELSSAMTSGRRFAAHRHGTDWEVLATEIVEDNAFAIKKAIEAAKAIEKETGETVNWRELCPLPTPDGMKITVGDEPAADEAPSTTPAKKPAEKTRAA